MSNANPDFPSDHIDFQNHDHDLTQEEKLAKTLTFIGASAVSLLCYETEDDVANVLRNDDRFKLVRAQNIVSCIWPVVNVAAAIQPGQESHAVALLAWSSRLQTLFLGFRGTQSMADVLSNLNVVQAATPNLGSRFHAGFLARASQYTAMIEQLVKEYKLVVCGHSLGGAMATIAAYQVLANGCNFRSIGNVWNANKQRRLSTVTFGSPSAMVVEDPGTTAALRREWALNFHHVINPDDYIPFALNHTSQLAKAFWPSAVGTFLTAFPQLEPFKKPLGLLLEYWQKNRAQFAHFGCIYLLENSNPGINCRQITMERHIPSTPDVSQVGRFHSMEHYNDCIHRILRPSHQFHEIDPTTSMSVEQFRRRCLPLPEAVHECNGAIHDNKVMISITVKSRLAQFFLKKVTFKVKGTEVQVSNIHFALKPDNHDQIIVKLQYDIDPNEELAGALALVYSIQRGLCIHNVFGGSTVLSVSEIRSTSLRYASLPTTFESLRLAMIIAFADQIAKVQALKLNNGESDETNRENAGALTERAASIANLVDGTVSAAVPHLVVSQLQHALGLMKELWPNCSWNEQSSPLRSRQMTVSGEEAVPGSFPMEQLKDRIPSDCPDELRRLLCGMMDALQARGLRASSLSLRAWERQGQWKLADVVPEITSFAETLRRFGRNFYDRPINPKERIEHAINQASEVLTAIRFCHFIILTQLDAPNDWCYEAKEDPVPFGMLAAGGGPLWAARSASKYLAATVPAMEGTVGLGLVALTSVLGFAASAVAFFVGAGIYYSLLPRKELLQLNFENKLQMSLEVLGIQCSPLNSIVEAPLTNHLKDDMQNEENPQTLKDWQQKLKKGIKKHPAVKSNWLVDPTIYWSKWLFNVARVGQLRDLMASQIRIGVEGPTEAGKSQLLTTLTGAPEEVFRPGSGANCRTMEIQLYNPLNLSAVFMDCPGADDKDERIREMASVFREMFGIIIFVIPSDIKSRSKATDEALQEIANFLRNHKDLRPVRILLSKADQLNFNRKKDEVFPNALLQSKKTVIEELKHLGKLGDDFVVHSRRACGDTFLLATETLEDIVQPYSTYAQMSLDGRAALSDCPPDEERMVEGLCQFQSLYQMAEEGKMWDVESLRQWLRMLSPNSVPNSGGRVYHTK